MAWDPKTRQLILFGGWGGVSGSSGPLADTWSWNGETWEQLTPTVSPPARVVAMMAWDGSLHELVLFGGTGSSGADLNDTWAWTGTDWKELSPTVSPPAQDSGTLSWDVQSKQLVLYCGNRLPETWAFAGTTWTELSPATTPTPRDRAGMAYDPTIKEVVLFGGYYGNGFTSFLNDTWAWNGTNWIQLASSASPAVRADVSMAWDQAAHRMVLFGGYGASLSDLGDTWTFGR
jgi:hypothetical protein